MMPSPSGAADRFEPGRVVERGAPERDDGVPVVDVWDVVCFLWLASSGSPRLPAPSPVGAILTSLLWIAGLVVAVWFSRWLVRGYLAWHLRAELRRRGFPICIACGYEGVDIHAPQCPECGAAQG